MKPRDAQHDYKDFPVFATVVVVTMEERTASL